MGRQCRGTGGSGSRTKSNRSSSSSSSDARASNKGRSAAAGAAPHCNGSGGSGSESLAARHSHSQECLATALPISAFTRRGHDQRFTSCTCDLGWAKLTWVIGAERSRCSAATLLSVAYLLPPVMFNPDLQLPARSSRLSAASCFAFTPAGASGMLLSLACGCSA